VNAGDKVELAAKPTELVRLVLNSPLPPLPAAGPGSNVGALYQLSQQVGPQKSVEPITSLMINGTKSALSCPTTQGKPLSGSQQVTLT
jgi:hypothetical protein